MGVIIHDDVIYGGGGSGNISLSRKIGTDTALGGQFITINGVESIIDGTGYMQKTQTLSTSQNNVYTFTNEVFTTDSVIDVYTPLDIYPIDIQLTAGQCQVIFEEYSSEVSMTCKIYIK